MGANALCHGNFERAVGYLGVVYYARGTSTSFLLCATLVKRREQPIGDDITRLCTFAPPCSACCRVRAFAGWPGTWALFSWGEGGEERKVKLITTAVGKPSAVGDVDEADKLVGGQQVVLRDDALELMCGDGSVIRVLELQPLNKKTMGAKAFANGLRGEEMTWVEMEPVEAVAAA